MLKAIANALAGLWRGALGVLRWTEQLVRWPFSLVFGSGGGAMPNPDYKPSVSSTELLEEFDAARAARRPYTISTETASARSCGMRRHCLRLGRRWICLG